MIRILIVIIGLLILTNSVYSVEIGDTANCKPSIDSISRIEYFVYTDSMPEYPGGFNEMLKFFMTNFKYPSEIDACCTVIVSFIIDSNGKMMDLKIVRGLQEDFDKETLRVMKLMPGWKPGKCNGQPVNVKFIIPWRIEL